MRIHFIIHSLIAGGAERVLVLISSFLANKNYDVTIITFSNENDYQLPENLKQIVLNKRKLKNKTLQNFLNLKAFYKKKEQRPDVIVSFITLNNLISILVAKLYKIKIIVSEHNSHLRAQSPRLLTKITRRAFYPMSDIVTVLTKYDLGYYNKRKCNTIVMSNPVTFEPLKNISIKENKVILAMGNLNRYHHKGFDNLISLISPILHSNRDWVLKIVGSGDTGLNKLKKIVQAENLKEQIIFTGFSNDVKKIMRESDIFVLSSRFEGLPMVLLEAMSQGMACIAFDCITGPSEMIVNDNNGLLIENQNFDAMKNGIERLIQSVDLRNNLALNAIKSLEKFDIEEIGGQWITIFESLRNK